VRSLQLAATSCSLQHAQLYSCTHGRVLYIVLYIRIIQTFYTHSSIALTPCNPKLGEVGNSQIHYHCPYDLFFQWFWGEKQLFHREHLTHNQRYIQKLLNGQISLQPSWVHRCTAKMKLWTPKLDHNSDILTQLSSHNADSLLTHIHMCLSAIVPERKNVSSLSYSNLQLSCLQRLTLCCLSMSYHLVRCPRVTKGCVLTQFIKQMCLSLEIFGLETKDCLSSKKFPIASGGHLICMNIPPNREDYS
jgi:hypothetical protein